MLDKNSKRYSVCHSSFSGDSETPMEAMIQAGIQKGLHHMCFTEHLDLDYPLPSRRLCGFFPRRRQLPTDFFDAERQVSTPN